MATLLAVVILMLIFISLVMMLTIADMRAEDAGDKPSFYSGFEIDFEADQSDDVADGQVGCHEVSEHRLRVAATDDW